MEFVLGRECKTEPGELNIFYITWTGEILRSPGQILGPVILRGISMIVVKTKESNNNVQRKETSVRKNSYCN